MRCEYLAVIDSEGLMSRTKTEDTDYDNELSTFIIGLSDLTLVIIKGEGSEMHDVLPLAIHVFLQMNIVGEHQACHFVHQNMGAADAMTKVSTEIDAFVRDLNEKTLAAAKDADQSDKYKKFTDVLHYNPRTDNTYVPGLWNGTPPMGKTNSHYSKMMQKLKQEVTRSITNAQAFKLKRLCTFTELAKRLNELWTAIKYENFVLSFKNVLAVEVHKKLTKVFDELQWVLKREIHEMTQQEKCIIENEMVGGPSSKDLTQLIEASKHKIRNCISVKTGEIERKILHYFKCARCDDCNTSVTNRHLLVHNEKEFVDEVQSLKRGLNRDLDFSMEKLELKLTTDKHIHELSAKMDEMLKVRVQEAIQSGKSKDLTRRSLDQMFEKLWEEVASDVLRRVTGVERHENIEAAVQGTIRSLLGPEDHHYMRVSANSPPKFNLKTKSGKTGFKVISDKHMRLNINHWTDFRKQITDQDINRLQMTSEQIINHTRHFYECASPEGKQFDQREVEELFVDVISQIDAITDERFKIHFRYKADLLIYIEKASVTGFTEMHENYCNSSSPVALLAEKKNSYHDLFILSMGHDDKALNFCENFLKDMMMKNIQEQLSCTELLHDLRVHCGNLFRDIKSIQAAIMTDLLKKNRFSYYVEYITDYKGCVKRKIESESLEHFTDRKRFKALAQVALDRICNTILQAMDNTLKTSCSNTNFIKTFLANMEHLKISHNEASAYLELNISNREKFRRTVEQQLKGRVKNEIRKKIDYWKVKNMLKQKKITEFLFKELVGCFATCPFCKVPCDSHSGGKTLGKHSATLHRPGGLGSYRWHNTGKRVIMFSVIV